MFGKVSTLIFLRFLFLIRYSKVQSFGEYVKKVLVYIVNLRNVYKGFNC